MAPDLGDWGVGLRSGAALFGERPIVYWIRFNSINLWLSMVNRERKLLFNQVDVCDNIK
jgi:hypothetical protein